MFQEIVFLMINLLVGFVIGFIGARLTITKTYEIKNVRFRQINKRIK